MAKMRKRTRWLGRILRMKDDTLQTTVLIGQRSRTNEKQVVPNGVGGRRREVFEEMETSLEGVRGCFE